MEFALNGHVYSSALLPPNASLQIKFTIRHPQRKEEVLNGATIVASTHQLWPWAQGLRYKHWRFGVAIVVGTCAARAALLTIMILEGKIQAG